jgi:hypothetical protein
VSKFALSPCFLFPVCRGFSVHPSQLEAQAIHVRIARIGAACALVLVLLVGTVPVGSFSLAAASECSMSCCIGLPSHRPGECESAVSCHVKLPEQIEASDALALAEQAQDMAAPAHHDHGDGAAAVEHQPAAESQTAAHDASHDASHAAQTETRQAQTRTASHSSASPASSPSEQTAEQSDAKKPRRHASIARVALANPCPLDCGMASSFINALRSRDDATLAGTHRPRPPTSVVAPAHASGLPLKFSAGKYCLAPPRGPPAFLNSTPA